jgi:hypothetical protein
VAQFARQFTRPDDEVITSLGNVSFGATSVAAMVKTTDVTNTKVVISAGATGEAWTFQVDPDESVAFFTVAGGGVKRNSAVSRIVSGRWHLIAYTKASGTVTPRFHIYDYTTRLWVHENGGGTQADLGGPPSIPATIWLAQDNASAGAGWSGQIQIEAYWNRELSDADCEALTDTRLAWDASTPAALWPLTQQTTATNVTDTTGGGANQTTLTGTSVVIGNPDFDNQPPKTFAPVPLMKGPQ